MTRSCKGSRYGYRATYYAGIIEEDSIALIKGKTDSIQFSMTNGGNLCTHIWKTKYGSVRGKYRKQQVDAIADGTD